MSDYRKILTEFMKQTNPDYEIPKGFHVHHIIPQSEAKRLGWSDEQIHHPSNLTALSPEDHLKAHLERGDTYLNNKWITCNSDQIGNNNGFYGRIHSDETKKKISRANKGKTRSEEFKNKYCRGENASFYNKSHTPETIQQMKETYYKNNKPLKCEYCDFTHTNKGIMKRHHNDNCKYKLEPLVSDQNPHLPSGLPSSKF